MNDFSLAEKLREAVQCGFFDRWAEVYDDQLNPLILLEERIVSPLILPSHNLDVIDAGCGTGRWLERIVRLGPRSLTGIDTSMTMLDKAKAKLGASAVLHRGDCADLPVAASSTDLLLCSFVLSYVAGVAGFARECARVLRPGGTIVLSDMHPTTAIEHQWKRSFQSEGVHLQLTSHHRSLEAIAMAFETSGFTVVQRLEPCFDLPERHVFANAGKLSEFASLAGVPAIYVLALRRSNEIQIGSGMTADLRLDRGRCAISPTSAEETSIAIQDGRISFIGDRDLSISSLAIDLSNYLLLPGLVNAHDHLEFGLFPRLGRAAEAPPYLNAQEWAQEIHLTCAEQIAEHQSVALETRLWWGAIRNLLCGVTTVCHHNPLHHELLASQFPVRVISRFGWAHSPAFDSELVEKFRNTPSDIPFITHAGEGTDASSRDEIVHLHRMKTLDDRTIVVHGLAITEDSAALINECGASLVICPTSNRFLFHKSLQKQTIDRIHRVAIGSDSPLTADGDLLNEVQYVHAETGLPAELIYRMVTTTPAGMLRLHNGEGSIRQDGLADIIAISDSGSSPASTVANLRFDQVELVLVAGAIHLASQHLYDCLPELLRQGLEPLEIDGHVRWLKAPIRRLVRSAQNVLGRCELVVGGKRMRLVHSA